MDDLDTDYSFEMSSLESHVLAQSSPTLPLEREVEIKKQISAPSYLYSLKENPAPPFKKPDKEPKPILLKGTLMNETEAVEMIERLNEQDDENAVLEEFIVRKKITQNFNITEKKFLVIFLRETIEYAAQRDFNETKLSCLITVYMNTHLFFKRYYWLLPKNLWNYFKEVMIRHTIEDAPDGQEVFEPEECYDIITHFHTIYLSNLPLIHILTFGVYKVKFTWPFKKANVLKSSP